MSDFLRLVLEGIAGADGFDFLIGASVAAVGAALGLVIVAWSVRPHRSLTRAERRELADLRRVCGVEHVRPERSAITYRERADHHSDDVGSPNRQKPWGRRRG